MTDSDRKIKMRATNNKGDNDKGTDNIQDTIRAITFLSMFDCETCETVIASRST